MKLLCLMIANRQLKKLQPPHYFDPRLAPTNTCMHVAHFFTRIEYVYTYNGYTVGTHINRCITAYI